MAPEYIKNGNFSVKSDVYSFGVLVLELLAGEKNSNFRNLTNIQSHVSIGNHILPFSVVHVELIPQECLMRLFKIQPTTGMAPMVQWNSIGDYGSSPGKSMAKT